MSFPSRASSDAAPLLEEFSIQERYNVQISEKLKNRKSLWFRFQSSSRIILIVLRPSFLLQNSSLDQQPHYTAWLDGCRGVASFLVYVYHWQHMFHQGFNYGYASNNGDNDHWLIQLPIVRLLANGQVQVATFYVLSGISLSLRPLRLARSHEWDTLLHTMFSSVFRRALRLYLPVFAVQICVLLATLMGFYNHGYILSQNWPYAGTNELMHNVFDTNGAQIEDWVRAMWNFSNSFNPNRPLYDVHLWTIPVEFINSILLFVILVGLSQLRPRVRISLTMILWVYCMSWSVVESQTALFIAGIGIAEFILIQEEAEKSSMATTGATTSTPWYNRTASQVFFWPLLYLIGLHCLSYPPWNADRAPGYRTLARITPSHQGTIEYFWQRLGAPIFLFALSGSAFLRHPFQTRAILYLGKISFPLYIVHGPMNHTLGLWLVTWFMKFTGAETFAGYESAVALAFCVEALFVVWLADLVMRAVDSPSVRFGRWLQSKLEVN